MKQRVLIVNKFYYRRGGDCIYTLNLEQMLKNQGHNVAVYAMSYPENEPSEQAASFASTVDFGGGIKQKLQAAKRTLGIGDIRRSFAKVLRDFKPDVVHLNNIHSYLSPVVAEMARKAGARVVWTLHDYKLLCPAYSCLCHGEICERCFADKRHVISQRCMKGSLAASVVAWAEARQWNRKRLERSVDAFICPSDFMASKMNQGGFDSSKLLALNNFIAPELWQPLSQQTIEEEREPYYCYVGRLSSEKGIATLLQVAATLPYRLKVAGDGPLAAELRALYATNPNIEFMGQLAPGEVARLLSHATAAVTPSECYENNPLSVIEALCHGTPVVGARIGGIPELISPDNGVIFRSRDVQDLAHAIQKAFSTAWNHKKISVTALNKFNPDNYYHTLNKIYQGNITL